MRLLPCHFRLSWVRHWSQCWCDTNWLHFADDMKRATCDVTRHGSFTQHERQAITKTWKPFRRWESKKYCDARKIVFDDEQRLTRHDGRVLDVGRVTSCVRVSFDPHPLSWTRPVSCFVSSEATPHAESKREAVFTHLPQFDFLQSSSC